MQKFSSRLVQSRMKRKFADLYSDVIQKVLNEIHDIWQDRDIDMSELFAELPEFKKFLFAMAKLNQQVENGGWSQWISNGYADDTGEYLVGVLTTITKDPNQEHMSQLKYIRRMLDRVAGRLEDKDGDFSWDRAQEILEDEGGDPEEKFKSKFEDSEYDRLLNEYNNQLRRKGKTLGIDVPRITVEDIYQALGSDDFGDDVTFGYEGKQLTCSEIIAVGEKLGAYPSDENEEESDEAQVWRSFVQELEDLCAWLTDSDLKADGDEEVNFHDLDSQYYRFIKGDLLWKDVAHAAELMATGDDFEEPAMEATEEKASSVEKESSLNPDLVSQVTQFIKENDLEDVIDPLLNNPDVSDETIRTIYNQVMNHMGIPEEARAEVIQHFSNGAIKGSSGKENTPGAIPRRKTLEQYLALIEDQIDNGDPEEVSGDLSDVMDQMISNAGVPNDEYGQDIRHRIKQHYGV